MPIEGQIQGKKLSNERFPFEAVLWDMDGTLIDSEPIWIEEERQLMRSLGVDWTDEDAHHCLGGPMERVDAYMRERSGNRHEPLLLSSMLVGRMEERLSSQVPFTKGAELLLNSMHLERIPMALVSASTRAIMNAALQSIGSHFFQCTFSSNDVENTKPHPEGYLRAAEHLGVPIESSLIIEDSHTGMSSAIESGAYVLGLPHLTPLPSGPKVVHRSSLEGLNLESLADLFNGIISQ